MLDHFQADAVLGRSFGGGSTATSLIDVGDLDGVRGDIPHGFGQVRDLGAILIGGRCHVQRQQVPERIDGDMHLGAFLSFGTVIASKCTTFRG